MDAEHKKAYDTQLNMPPEKMAERQPDPFDGKNVKALMALVKTTSQAASPFSSPGSERS